jgi:hypothetical protein
MEETNKNQAVSRMSCMCRDGTRHRLEGSSQSPSLFATCFLPVPYFACSSALNMEAVQPSETSADFYLATCCYIAEDSSKSPL